MATTVVTAAPQIAPVTTTTAPAIGPPPDPGVLDPKYSYVLTFKQLLLNIDTSVGKAQGLATPDTALISDYTTLKTDIQAVYYAYATTDITALTNKTQDFQGRLDILDARLAALLPTPVSKEPTAAEVAAMTAKKTAATILFVTILIGMFLGGIVVSHAFIETPLMYRLYYFFYGAALFPISLAYGVYDPPIWRAVLFPLFEKGDEPASLKTFPLSLVWSLIAFSAPNPDDYDTIGVYKNVLRLACGAVLSVIVGAYMWGGGSTKF